MKNCVQICCQSQGQGEGKTEKAKAKAKAKAAAEEIGEDAAGDGPEGEEEASAEEKKTSKQDAFVK